MLARSSNCWLCSYLLFVLASLFQHLKLLTLGSLLYVIFRDM